jgi:hypothetical protein
MSIIPMVTPGAKPPALEFLQTADNTANQSSYTFSSQNLGDAHGSRLIIALVLYQGNTTQRTVSSATINGVSADVVVERGDGNSFHGASLIQAQVPTGTTGDVVINFSGGVTKCGIALYRATGLRSVTAADSDSDTDDVVGLQLAVAKDSIMVAGAIFDATNEIATTSNGDIVEDVDQTIEANDRIVSASASGLASSAAYTIGFDGGSGDAAGVAATWR